MVPLREIAASIAYEIVNNISDRYLPRRGPMPTTRRTTMLDLVPSRASA
jgi:hypothetical protein